MTIMLTLLATDYIGSGILSGMSLRCSGRIANSLRQASVVLKRDIYISAICIRRIIN